VYGLIVNILYFYYILPQRVRERDKSKLNAEEVCSATQGMLVNTHSVNEEHLNGDGPEELSSQQSSTTQILYQRQKDV
jgi:hypothetical protein